MSVNHRPGPGPVKRLIMSAVRILFHNPIGASVAGISRIIYPRNGGNWVDVSQVRLELPRLSPEFNGYRIAQISDFHYGTWLTSNELEHAVNLVNQQRVDLVAITGDFVTYHLQIFSEELISILGKIHAPDGVVAVLGNHDHWSDPDKIRNILRQANIKELKNDVFSLTRGAGQLHICGIDDFMDGHDRLDQVLEKLPDGGAAILLAHEPDFADISAQTGCFDLQISGHSHGGQIVFPWIGAIVLPSFAHKYTSGMYRVNGMLQYTNRGLGTAELQVRFNCRPEITIFTLQYVK
jgi:uncharacterized protein